MDKRTVSVRRNIEQVKHCVEEALSVIENEEDVNCAIDDLAQASQLLQEAVLPRLRASVTPKDSLRGR